MSSGLTKSQMYAFLSVSILSDARLVRVHVGRPWNEGECRVVERLELARAAMEPAITMGDHAARVARRALLREASIPRPFRDGYIANPAAV